MMTEMSLEAVSIMQQQVGYTHREVKARVCMWFQIIGLFCVFFSDFGWLYIEVDYKLLI